MVSKTLCNFILFLLNLCILVGCTDYPSIEKHNFIIGTLYDYNSNKYQSYHEVQNLQRPHTTENISTENTNKIVFSEGDTWLEAFVNFVNSCDQRINGSTGQITLYTEKFAKKEGAIEESINFDYASPYPRVHTIVAIFGGEVEELVSMEPENENSIFLSVRSTIKQLANARWEGGIRVFKSDIKKWSLSKEIGLAVPYVTAQEEQLKLSGYGILHEGRLIGIISLDESRGLLYLLGEKLSLKYQITNLFAKKSTIQFTVKPQKPRIKVDFHENQVSFNITVDAIATFDYVENQETVDETTKKQIIKTLKEKIEKEITKTIDKSQKEYKVDYLKFNQQFNAKYRGKIKDEEWNYYYQNAHISVDVNIILASGKLELQTK